MTDDKKKDKKANEDGQEVKKVDDAQLEGVAGGVADRAIGEFEIMGQRVD